MDENVKEAMRYLATPAGSFWKWVDYGKVIAWKHGATVAFREELAAVLTRLSPRGLPPLDSVLLLLAATRAYWKEDSAAIREKLLGAPPPESNPTLTSEGIGGAYHRRMTFMHLNQIHELPEDLIRSPESKALLAEVVFESLPTALTGTAADYVCQLLEHGLIRPHQVMPNLARLRGGRVQSWKKLSHDLVLMEQGLAGVDAQVLRTRNRTGLDAPPLPADLLVPAESTSVRLLLRQLTLDDELSGVARIARNLSAVVQLPRPITDSDELPLGGVSDISNRGSLDRLLLSELAHEDLMLATRIALNEALYLRRETPPSPPPQRRYILMDSGLRMWGVPRVFAAAAMLSLAATGATGDSLIAYRASGTRIVPIDLTTAAGLMNHLESLETEMDPRQSLEAFFDAIDFADGPAEALIITSDLTLRDPDFRQALHEFPICYVATVNRAGEFALSRHNSQGTRPLTSLKLNLDELLNPGRQRTQSRINQEIDPRLPAIFRVAPFPLRLPYQHCRNQNREVIWSVRLGPQTHPDSVKGSMNQDPEILPPGTSSTDSSDPVQHGAMILTKDRRVLFFDCPDRGSLQIAENVPFGRCLWHGNDDEISAALLHRPAESLLFVLVVNLKLKQAMPVIRLQSNFISIAGAGSKVIGAIRIADVLCAVFASRIEAFDMHGGQLLYEMEIDARHAWRGGRFFYDSSAKPYEEWNALTCDGNGLRFEPIRLQGPERTGLLLRLFDRLGHDGPYGVHLRGSIANLANQTEWEWTQNARSNPVVLDISDDGHRLLIEQDSDSTPRKRAKCLINMELRRVATVYATTLAGMDLSRLNLGPGLLHRMTSIFVGGDGSLTLVSKKSKMCRSLAIHNGHLALRPVDGNGLRSHSIDFQQARHPNPGCEMHVAEWKDGSRALIDSRGLLHLQSSDSLVPEASLVLTDHEVAAWTNDGRVLGSQYYLSSTAVPWTVTEFFKQVLNPFVERLQSHGDT